ENNRTEVIKNDSHLTVANNRFSHTQGNSHHTTDGEHRESIGADYSLTVNGSHHNKQGKNQLVEAGTEIHHKAGMKIVIEAGAEVTLKAGGSFVKVDPSGVTVSGPLVRMNSGGGPGSGSATAEQEPLKPPRLGDQEQPSNGADYLAETSQRANALEESSWSLASANVGKAPLLKQAAQEGALTVTACEFDEHGRCALHQHT
ncbi:bacteriophage T4 gp5 trimerization domain-containing protein, partial [Marinobacter sp. SBS5]|uniref:bacteriophage T4 gp5 trimerisation domain-containing protein n=1 Tax=Marinobacter sp. SBS5 TaxID=3401754 RepID=UPI003AAA71FB